MTISSSFELANNSEFRLLANFTTPPRAGTVTAIEPSGQVRVATNDPDGGDVLAWPLNGFTYAVNDVVYIAFAENSPDSAIVLGSRSPLPTSTAPIEASPIITEIVRARDGDGVRIEDDGSNLGVYVEDGGNVGIGPGATNPATTLLIRGATATSVVVSSQDGDSSNGNASFQIINDAAVVGAITMARSGLSGKGSNLNIESDNEIRFYASDRNTLRAIISGANNGWGVASPQGKLHAHDGRGGLLFVTKGSITNVAQTIIPNGGGDVTAGIAGFFVAHDGGAAVGSTFSLLPGANMDVVLTGMTLRLTLNANGSLTAVRQSGSGSATLALLGVWL